MQIDAREGSKLAADLTAMGPKAVVPMRAEVEKIGKMIERKWRSNARVTSGRRGHRYPSSVTTELLPSFRAITVEVGPDSSKPQGSMGRGFEFGSINQFPHMDGSKALDHVTPRAQKALDAAVERLLP